LTQHQAAPFSKEYQILIKSLYEYKDYNARQFITEFPDKDWTKNCISLGICFKKMHLIKVGAFA